MSVYKSTEYRTVCGCTHRGWLNSLGFNITHIFLAHLKNTNWPTLIIHVCTSIYYSSMLKFIFIIFSFISFFPHFFFLYFIRFSYLLLPTNFNASIFWRTNILRLFVGYFFYFRFWFTICLRIIQIRFLQLRLSFNLCVITKKRRFRDERFKVCHNLWCESWGYDTVGRVFHKIKEYHSLWQFGRGMEYFGHWPCEMCLEWFHIQICNTVK